VVPFTCNLPAKGCTLIFCPWWNCLNTLCSFSSSLNPEEPSPKLVNVSERPWDALEMADRFCSLVKHAAAQQKSCTVSVVLVRTWLCYQTPRKYLVKQSRVIITACRPSKSKSIKLPQNPGAKLQHARLANVLCRDELQSTSHTNTSTWTDSLERSRESNSISGCSELLRCCSNDNLLWFDWSIEIIAFYFFNLAPGSPVPPLMTFHPFQWLQSPGSTKSSDQQKWNWELAVCQNQ
jgi:hypothetical protein